jgi:hypothetical protein
MRIFNEDKTQEIQDYNKELYYLKNDKLFIQHHEAIEEIKQVSHLEIVRKNKETGGVEYQEIIDIPHQPAKEAYDEYEDIQVIVPYTKEQLAQNKVNELTSWFDNYFDKQFKQSQWQNNFKVSKDPYFKDENGQPRNYADIEELKAQAEIVRKTINSLRNEV